MEENRCDLKYISVASGIGLRCGLTRGHAGKCGPAPMLTGYGARVDGGFTLLIGLTPNEFERLEREPFSLPISDQYKPLKDVLVVFGRNREELEASIRSNTHSRKIPLQARITKPRIE